MKSEVPRVGIGVLVVRDGRVLLGRRQGSHGAGTWALPGGHLEYGETVAAGALRELKEETSLIADRIEPAPWTESIRLDEGRHHVILFVQALGVRGDPQTCEPDKCDGWDWFAWSSLPSPLFEPLANLVRSGYRPAGVI